MFSSIHHMIAEGFNQPQKLVWEGKEIRIFFPSGYEPRYAYPLIVMLHANGSNDEQILRYAPKISNRNHIFISLRGPESTEQLDENGQLQYGWGDIRSNLPAMEQYLFHAIQHARRSFNIHTQRIFLAGIAEGADLAYHVALNHPEKLAGLVAINGSLPREYVGPPFQNNIENLRILISHGAANEVIPLETARRDFLSLYSAGVDVTLNTYPATHQIHPNMLRDINRWIIRGIDRDMNYECDSRTHLDN
ncbi:MAG: hypothetical protein R3B84_21670 [Zavarzinella sp.]